MATRPDGESQRNETGRDCSRPVRVPAVSTSRPEVRKAHGNAAWPACTRHAEPRKAGLIQTAWRVHAGQAKAVLEQPSSRRMTSQTLGRRNIVLLPARSGGTRM